MKVFFPIRWIDVEAEGGVHPPNTFYRVSIGHEHWDGGPQQVYKVQMVYNGAVSGRRSPSFPVGSRDWENVIAAMEELKAGGGSSGRGQINPV